MLSDIAELISQLPLDEGFSVCEMGDQYLTEPKEGRLSQDWFVDDRKAGSYVSIDANGRGTVVADLNLRLDHLNLGQFDLVTDLGTGEHVFNQHQFWKSVHDLTRVGGYVVFDKPTSGYPEHGFYTYSQTFFEDLAFTNHYEIKWLDHRDMPRGRLIRGCWRRRRRDKFLVPYQGRYVKSRRVD